MNLRLLLLLAALLGSAPLASAQSGESPNGVFLVATPALVDPNFRHSVVLVTQAPDGSTVGFIVNRPGRRSLAEILPDNELLKRFTEPLYLGGPVEGAGLFAVFRAKENPPGALRVLDDVSFALDPAVVEKLLHAPPQRVRFFNGFAGWAPGQLAAELERGGWYLLNADAETVFRKDMDGLWEELLVRARAVTAFLRSSSLSPCSSSSGASHWKMLPVRVTRLRSLVQPVSALHALQHHRHPLAAADAQAHQCVASAAAL